MHGLPIIQNRKAQFAARFEQRPDGSWLWYADDISGGVPVREDEMVALISEHHAIFERTEKLMRWWVPLAFVGIIVCVFGLKGQVPNWVGPAIMAIPLPWIIYKWYRADRLPHDRVGNRFPVTHARGRLAGGMARLAAIPITLPLMMIGVGGLLLFQLWRLDQIASDNWGVAIGIGVIAFGSFIFFARGRI